MKGRVNNLYQTKSITARDFAVSIVFMPQAWRKAEHGVYFEESADWSTQSSLK